MATAARPRADVSHADLIRVLVANAPPLPDEQREQVRKLIKRGSTP